MARRSQAFPPYPLLSVLCAGSLWALSEVGLSAALRALAPALRAAGLAGVGAGLMGFVWGATGRPWVVVPVALVAATGRQLGVVILGNSFLCKANASLAILLEAMCVGAAVAVVRPRSSLGRGLTAAVAMLAAAASFWAVGMHVAPCEYLLSFRRPWGILGFLGREGVAWASLAGLLLPAGAALGTRWASLCATLPPAVVYAGSSVAVAAAWITSLVMTAAGY